MKKKKKNPKKIQAERRSRTNPKIIFSKKTQENSSRTLIKRKYLFPLLISPVMLLSTCWFTLTQTIIFILIHIVTWTYYLFFIYFCLDTSHTTTKSHAHTIWSLHIFVIWKREGGWIEMSRSWSEIRGSPDPIKWGSRPYPIC